MSLLAHQLELLSPARNADIAKEAILHGADAVYIGGPGFGARHNAANSISDIANVVEFAHQYHAKVFVTLNTILHDNELEAARRQIFDLYDAGVDALIVQDMGVLEMDIPPIELHASTQCDIRSVEKAQFLSQAGFSQIVLARELNLQEIKAISDSVDAAVEFFVHGALCVAFSGQCNISHAQTGRSANRGDCSQACRLPYTLKDKNGAVVAYDKHLLSMKDNNQSNNIDALVEAGVRSFKIEGRYKDLSYVKNITAHYRQLLDKVLQDKPELAPASSGRTEHFFVPNPDKTFHRSSTDYFVVDRQIDIGAFDSPKFVGLPVGEILSVGKSSLQVQTTTVLNNGDGLNILHKREVLGFRLNTAKQLSHFEQDGQQYWQYHLELNAMPDALRAISLPQPLNRNLDHNWQQALLKRSAERKVAIKLAIESSASALQITLSSEEGITVTKAISGPFELAKQADRALQQLQDTLSQVGNTLYYISSCTLDSEQAYFIPQSQVKALRREAIDAMDQARLASVPRGARKAPSKPAPTYPETQLSFLANVYNQKARDFYYRHGVQLIDAAYEAHEEKGDVSLMITKHCLRFSFNLCPKQAKGFTGVRNKVSDMQLVHDDEVLRLKFDCKACEMHVIGKIKANIFESASPGSTSHAQQNVEEVVKIIQA
ncbi:U32 family peptidase [Parahaliea sp. F7430]|uniref:U32 family peptidase n=1 Tax=Sediminihaliea albiluteola TaxID=2758564 RepID=A0A7W2TWF9_9GAMM|nr:U32 family peptidase [Sediminihaliea albiluteola]MBA6413171.1 U32 family peptidase [Sediminihaliea albiluteola]